MLGTSTAISPSVSAATANPMVYRDQSGAAATPTSDSTRTMTSLETRRLLFIINAYDGNRAHTEAAVAYALELLRRYADTHDERVVYF